MSSGVIKLFIHSLSLAYDRRVATRLPWFLTRLKWQPLFTGIALLSLFATFLVAVQFSSPNLVGNDGYFHIKFAQVMQEQGLRPAMPWLPLTILNPNDYVDHHFLYHVLLIPFTYGDLRLGAKWAGAIFPALAFLMGWIFLRGQRIPSAALWSLGFLAVSHAFLYRLSMPRVQAVSLLMLFLILHVSLTHRYRWLLPLTFIYVWLYDAFPFIILMVGIYTANRWLLDRHLNWRPLGYVTLGVGLGLLINPYFPKNLLFIYHHFLPKLTATTALNVGIEWAPYETWRLVENAGPALLAFVAGAFALSLSRRRVNVNTATLFWVAVLFGFLLLKSRRFIEYYPAFALLFAASAWASLRAEWLPAKPWLNRLEPIILVIILLPAIWYNFIATQESLQDSQPYQRYAQASAWLKANTPAGSRVFQTDWDDFSQLYFHNIHNTYTLGLDPTYMQLYNAEMYTLWVDISQGRVALPSRPIADTFGAAYVITDLKHRMFLREAADDPGLEEVHRGEDAIVFRVHSNPQ